MYIWYYYAVGVAPCVDNQFRNCLNFIPRQIQCSEGPGVVTVATLMLSLVTILQKTSLTLSIFTVLLKATPVYSYMQCFEYGLDETGLGKSNLSCN